MGAQVSSRTDWDLLREHTRYDQEIYDFARELTGRPINPFYADYNEFLMKEGPLMLVEGLCAILLCCGCCSVCMRLTRVATELATAPPLWVARTIRRLLGTKKVDT